MKSWLGFPILSLAVLLAFGASQVLPQVAYSQSFNPDDPPPDHLPPPPPPPPPPPTNPNPPNDDDEGGGDLNFINIIYGDLNTGGPGDLLHINPGFGQSVTVHLNGMISGEGNFDVAINSSWQRGEVNFNGQNTYSGTTSLHSLRPAYVDYFLVNPQALGTDPRLHVGNYAHVTSRGHDFTLRGLLTHWSSVLELGGSTWTLNMEVDGWRDLYGAVISGTIIKQGEANLNLYGGATFRGANLHVTEGGVVIVSPSTVTPVFDGSANLTLDADTWIDFSHSSESVGRLINAGELMFNGGSLTIMDGGNSSVGGNVSGSGNLLLGGGDELVLNAALDFTGFVGALAGELTFGDQFSTSGPLGLRAEAGPPFELNRARILRVAGLRGAGTILGASGIDLINVGEHFFSGELVASGWLIQQGPGLQDLSGATMTLAGTRVENGVLAIDPSTSFSTPSVQLAGGELRINGTGEIGLDALFVADARLSNQQAIDWTGAITGEGGLIKSGEGRLTLQGSVTYEGDTLVEAGTLASGGNQGLPVQSRYQVATGATLDFNGFDQTVAGLEGAGTVALGGAALIVNHEGSSTFSGDWQGAGTLSLRGDGIWTVTGELHGIELNLESATLAVAGPESLGLGVITFTGGQLALGLGGELSRGAVFATDTRLTLDHAISWSGNSSGVGGLIKSGDGRLTLLGTHTYQGDTLIEAGTLASGANNSFASQSRYHVAAGATLDFDGFDQTIAGLEGMGTVALGGASLIVNHTGASTFSGDWQGAGALSVRGDGIWTVTGDLDGIGLNLESATLSVAGPESLGSGALTFAGGLLSFMVLVY
ncbi:MAG: autotransporter-associated beta strand repeat-containing protein [Verrucomicrobia bacterium]|nr:autotransporter-associated beta strand repeat-containing protein [Verrucomicrobiota bacterium]